MKFTLSWLKEHLDTSASLKEISTTLTRIGLEVESITDHSATYEPFIVAEIRDAQRHPNAERLQVCRVWNGSEELQVVCGAPNARTGLKVILAPIGVTIPANGMVIKKSKIRDVESQGMLCSATELSLGEDSEGIVELPALAEVGKPFASFIGADNPLIDVAITANRGDCLGVRGIARDLAAAGLGTLKPIPSLTLKQKGASPITVEIKDSALCPGYIGCFITHVTNKESPEWLQRKLKSVGQKPISALVDITNYLSLTFGRPAHVYDADTLTGALTVETLSTEKTFNALNQQTYTLPAGTPVIRDSKNPVAVAGIIGGLESGCTTATKNVFLEIAWFDPIAVAKAGRALQIDTDARQRFERQIDPNFLKTGAELAVQLILDFCGGEASEFVTVGNTSISTHTLEYPLSYTAQRIGLDVSHHDATRILTALGFGVKDAGNTLQLTIPSWRNDVRIKEDIAEELGRIVGYDKVPLTPLPQSFAPAPVLSQMERRIQESRRTLAARGLNETVTYSFVSTAHAAQFSTIRPELELANPISSELNYMRPTILTSLLGAVTSNANRGDTDLALFECGPVFSGVRVSDQQRSIAGIRTHQFSPQTPHGAASPLSALDAKADALAALSAFVDVKKCVIAQTSAISYFHPGKAGTIKLGPTVLAQFGELHPSVLRALDIELPVVGFEVFLDALPTPKQKSSAARPAPAFSNLQRVLRDFAFIVDEKTPAYEVLRAALLVDKHLIADATLFDVYQGKGVEPGKKSLAITVTLVPQETTFTDAEIEAIAARIIASVQTNAGGVLRSAS